PVEEPFWPPDDDVASGSDERATPPRDQPPAVVHGAPVQLDPHWTPVRSRDEHVGSPWDQPPPPPPQPNGSIGAPTSGSRPEIRFEPGIYRPAERPASTS